jgi:ribonuclease P protein component
MRRFASLRRRGDFARLRQRGRRKATPSLTIFEADPGTRDAQPLVGITIGKAVGGAVVRNRLKRRIQAIVQELFLTGHARCRLLIIPRPNAAELPFGALRAELLEALQ